MANQVLEIQALHHGRGAAIRCRTAAAAAMLRVPGFEPRVGVDAPDLHRCCEDATQKKARVLHHAALPPTRPVVYVGFVSGRRRSLPGTDWRRDDGGGKIADLALDRRKARTGISTGTWHGNSNDDG